MKTGSLQAIAADPREYLRRVRIETDGRPEYWADVADPWQLADAEAILPALAKLVRADAPEPEVSRCWWERGRGSAKTSDFALLLLWVLLFSRRRRRAVWAAADADQGLMGLDACRVLFTHNAWMRELLVIQADRIVNPRTESVCSFVTADAPTAFGWIPDLLIFDELTHWKREDLWTALFSAVGKRRDCVLMVGMNAGWEDTWQARLRGVVMGDSGWYFSSLPGPVASWIGEDKLAEQRRMLPAIAYARLWENRWQSGAGGDAFEREDLDAAVTLPGASGWQLGYNYCAGVDLAVRQDSTAVCVLGIHVGHSERIAGTVTRPEPRIIEILREVDVLPPPMPEVSYRAIPGTGRLLLADCRVWSPGAGKKVSLEAVKAWIIDAHRKYRLRSVSLDPSQGELLAEQLRAVGVPVELRPQTGAALQVQSTALCEAIRERRLELYNHPDVLADLRAARVKETNYGWRLFHVRRNPGDGPGTGHGDAMTALSLALVACRRYRTQAAANYPGSLVLSPVGNHGDRGATICTTAHEG